MKFLTVGTMNLINSIVTVVISIIACASCSVFSTYLTYKCKFPAMSSLVISSSVTLFVMTIIDFICHFKEDIAANDMFQQIWLFIVIFAAVFNLLQIRKIIK